MRSLCVGAALAVGVFGSFGAIETSSIGPVQLVKSAQALVGRPLTPVSYAGVARRTTRRAVAVGAATAPVVAAPAPTCVQVVDAYGRVTYRCP